MLRGKRVRHHMVRRIETSTWQLIHTYHIIRYAAPTAQGVRGLVITDTYTLRCIARTCFHVQVQNIYQVLATYTHQVHPLLPGM